MNKLKRSAVLVIAICSSMILPLMGFGQPAPPGPGGTGGNPDTPLGVPFDDNLNMVLLAAGIVFAVVILKRMQKKYAVNTVK